MKSFRIYITALNRLPRAPLFLALAAFALGACAPQRMTTPERLDRLAGRAGMLTAVAVDGATGRRHLALAECNALDCVIAYTRRSEGGPALRASFGAARRYLQTLDIVATNDGGALAAWAEDTAGFRSAYRYRYSIVDATGTVTGPLPLGSATDTLNIYEGWRTPSVRLDRAGALVVAIFQVDRPSGQQLYYQRLAPVVSPPRLVFDQASMGGPGRIEAPRIVLLASGEAHMTWRQVRTGAGSLSQVGHAYVSGIEQSGALPAPSLRVLSPPGYSAGLPEIAVDHSVPASPRVWASFTVVSATRPALDQQFAVRIDGVTPVLTRTLAYSRTDFAPYPLRQPPAIGFWSGVPVIAMLGDRRSDGELASDVLIWNSSTTTITIRTDSGLAQMVKAATVRSQAPVFAYEEFDLRSSSSASALTVYDVFNKRAELVTSDRLWGRPPLTSNSWDIDAAGDTVAGAWIVSTGFSSSDAYDARNDLTPESLIYITTLNDAEAADADISLREAMRIANGSLTSGFSLAERTKLETAGCIFNGSGAIVAGCGRGVTDTLVFTNSLAGTVNLAAPLPVINDSAPTRIFGRIMPDETSLDESPPVTVAASSPPALQAVFVITSQNNLLYRLNIRGGERGVWIRSDRNQLADLMIQNASLSGVDIEGNDNLLREIVTGGVTMSAACGSDVLANGVRIIGPAARNRVIGSLFGCTRTAAVLITGASAVSNTLTSVLAGRPADFDGGIKPDDAVLIVRARETRLMNVIVPRAARSGITVQHAPDTKIESATVGQTDGPGVVIGGLGSRDVGIRGLTVYSTTTGIAVRAGAPAPVWLDGAYGPASDGRPIDTATPGADDPPPAQIGGYERRTGVVTGMGAPAGAIIEVHGVLTAPVRYSSGLALSFARALTRTVVAADGTWSAVLPPAPVVADDFELTPRVEVIGDAPATPVGYTGPPACIQIIVTTPTGGSSELGPLTCRSLLHLPSVMR